jgi:hypothetical protein
LRPEDEAIRSQPVRRQIPLGRHDPAKIIRLRLIFPVNDSQVSDVTEVIQVIGASDVQRTQDVVSHVDVEPLIGQRLNQRT